MIAQDDLSATWRSLETGLSYCYSVTSWIDYLSILCSVQPAWYKEGWSSFFFYLCWTDCFWWFLRPHGLLQPSAIVLENPFGEGTPEPTSLAVTTISYTFSTPSGYKSLVACFNKNNYTYALLTRISKKNQEFLSTSGLDKGWTTIHCSTISSW